MTDAQRPRVGPPEAVDGFEAAALARTAGRDIFGDLDDHVPEVRVPHHVKVDATKRAHELGLDITAFLRLNLYATLYGPDHVASLHKAQLERVLGNAGQKVGGRV